MKAVLRVSPTPRPIAHDVLTPPVLPLGGVVVIVAVEKEKEE